MGRLQRLASYYDAFQGGALWDEHFDDTTHKKADFWAFLPAVPDELTVGRSSP